MIRTSKILIKDKRFKNYAIDKVYLTRHFENIYILLLKQDYKQDIGDFKLLTNYRVMRAVIRDNKGGKLADKVKYIKDKYKNNQLMQDLIEVGLELKKHNFVMTMRKVKGDYKSFFTKRKKGDKARTPQAKKLSTLRHYTLELDSSSSISLVHLKKDKNKLGINLDSKMKYLYINHKAVTKLVDGDLNNIQSINLHYANGELYLLVSYHKKINTKSNKTDKIAGLDVGINNLASIYIDDEDSPSLIIDGKKYKTYNSKFNRFIAKLTNTIDTLDNQNRIEYLQKYKSFLFEKRNRFFFDQFHKISKMLLEYLVKHNVSELVISKNLNKLKNNGNCNLKKKAKQNFIQIPFAKLLENLEYKALEYGIKITIVDEAYTSKSNSLTDDIYKVHSLNKKIKRLKNKLKNARGYQYYRLEKLINAYKKILKKHHFQGKRIKRGLYIDTHNNKAYNSDLNGAKNILKLSPNYKIKKYKLNYKKLCNAIKVENDYQLRKLVS